MKGFGTVAVLGCLKRTQERLLGKVQYSCNKESRKSIRSTLESLTPKTNCAAGSGTRVVTKAFGGAQKLVRKSKT